MKKNNLKNKTIEELQSNLKINKLLSGILIGGITILVGFSIYGLLTKSNSGTYIPLFIMAFSFILIFPINYKNIKKIKKELKSRF